MRSITIYLNENGIWNKYKDPLVESKNMPIQTKPKLRDISLTNLVLYGKMYPDTIDEPIIELFGFRLDKECFYVIGIADSEIMDYIIQGIGIMELSTENSIDPDVFSKAVQVARQYRSTIVKQIQAQEEATAQQLNLLE